MPNPDIFQDEAKQFALVAVEERFHNVVTKPLEVDDLYVVWFAKTLQNYKALISTDRLSGVYIEVTFDGDKSQAYVDIYRKTHNQAIGREYLAEILAEIKEHAA